MESGDIELIDIAAQTENPSYLAIYPSNKYLYAVNEISDFDEDRNGSISAFKINSEAKNLELINKVSSRGAHPCHISVDEKSNFVLAANYSGGNISLFTINNADGSIQFSNSVKHIGSSINKERQNAPHAHSSYFGPHNKYVYAVDLGIDKVNIYQIDQDSKKLIINNPPNYECKPGCGPRHLSFHPNGKYAYLITELSNEIDALKIDDENGALEKIETYNTLPNNFEGASYCADIHVHPNGKFLYGSNRGDNSIVIFEINEESGKLILVGHESTKGDWPRNFVIDPSGEFLLAANQKSNNISVFKISKETGGLNFKDSLNLPSPVCIKFLHE